MKLLRDLLESHNGGIWPTLRMDLRSKPVKNFKTHTQTETITPQDDHSLQTLEAPPKGLQNNKTTTKHPTIMPDTLLPKHKRPKHYKTYLIIAIGYRKNS
jgi:hypothetical protein